MNKNIVFASTKPKDSRHLTGHQCENPLSRVVAFSVFVRLLAAESCRAEDFTATDVLQDARLYFTAPIRWNVNDWLYFGGALAVIGAAHAYDGEVRRHFAIGDRAILNGQDKNSVRDAIPAAAVVAATWAI